MTGGEKARTRENANFPFMFQNDRAETEPRKSRKLIARNADNNGTGATCASVNVDVTLHACPTENKERSLFAFVLFLSFVLFL